MKTRHSIAFLLNVETDLPVADAAGAIVAELPNWQIGADDDGDPLVTIIGATVDLGTPGAHTAAGSITESWRNRSRLET